ncbi:MAG: hypothetical protein ACP5IT_10940 [Thermoproteota archaeon]
MLTLSNDLFSVKIDKKDGLIKSLIGTIQGYPKVEFCDARPIRPTAPLFWGEVIVGDEILSYLASSGKVSTQEKNGSIEVLYEHEIFDLKVTRKMFKEYMDETYELIGKSSFTLTNLGFVFRPRIGLLVGEHEWYKLVNWTPTIFHWYTGNNLAYLLITHSTGVPPHLAIVLVSGSINGFSIPYTYLNELNHQEPLLMFPILHFTALALHKEEDEYPQPRVAIRPIQKLNNILRTISDADSDDAIHRLLQLRDRLSITFRYFLFQNWKDFEEKVVKVCNQPVFEYPHFVPVGSKLEVIATFPKNIRKIKAFLNGRELKIDTINEDDYSKKYLISTSVYESGIQKILFEYDNKMTFILFEGMRNLRDLLQARVNYILSKQLCLDQKDPKYGGIFAIDNLTESLVYSSVLGTCQLASTGEILLGSAALVLLKNLVDPKPEEIEKIETTACDWIKKKCMDENFAFYLNPLNKMKFKDSKWTYSKDKIDQYINPNNPREHGWRRWNALFIAPIFYLLSLFEDNFLRREKRDTYLLWSYKALKWYFETEPTFGGALDDYCLKIIAELQKRGYHKEAEELKNYRLKFIDALKEEAKRIDGKEFIRDELGVTATPLLLEKDFESALPYLKVNETGLGYSYDPRVQSAFRFWDDGASGGYYQLIPYLTMPHLWTGYAGYSDFLAYELTRKDEYLIRAYNAIMTFYEYYNYDYRWNKWGQLKKGQAHVNYLPSLDMSTQERYCVDQDMSVIPYMETFGKKCFVTRNGTLVNCHKDGNRVVSWAMYPREYILDNEKLVVKTDHPSVIINWIKVESERRKVTVEVENLSKACVKTNISLEMPDHSRMEEVKLSGCEKMVLTMMY